MQSSQAWPAMYVTVQPPDLALRWLRKGHTYCTPFRLLCQKQRQTLHQLQTHTARLICQHSQYDQWNNIVSNLQMSKNNLWRSFQGTPNLKSSSKQQKFKTTRSHCATSEITVSSPYCNTYITNISWEMSKAICICPYDWYITSNLLLPGISILREAWE